MAESILFGVAERIIGRLGSAAVREIGLQWGVNNELSGLEDTILTIKAVLVDAEEKKAHNHHVKAWLTRLEDVVYEADDLLDEFSTEALQQEVLSNGSETTMQVCAFFSTPNHFAFMHKMGHKIKSLKEKLDAIRDDRFFHLEVRSEETKVLYRAREHTHSFLSQEEVVVGRDDDKMKILKCLSDPETEENLLVIPIVGGGGLGKTTLARLVFNDEKVRNHFDMRMWVCVSSSDFDVKLLVEKIIRSATDNGRFENYEMESLQKELRQKIGGKRYLLVLDDVWNENREAWLSLRNLLLSGAKGSRIIVTTRSKMVAKAMSDMKPCFLGHLDEIQSWSLFTRMAFNQEQDLTNSNIVEIGKQIVEKCGGIPLAIRTIGRMLYFKTSEIEWSSFHNIEFSKISQDENDILPTLELSYNHLSSHLKHCFAFCSLFTKDHEIDVKDLINIWMAQGFIKSSNTTQSFEDVGLEYFMELYWKSFFQEVEEDAFGNIAKCKMHDLMHDLAVKVAGTECVMLPSDREKITKNARHVSFDFCLKSSRQIPTSLSQMSNRIRTILLLSQPWWDIQGIAGVPLCDVIVSNFKFLRTLDLHNSGIKTVPDSICKLKHLRYLDLSKTKIKVLPNSVTKLHNLQTLKLSKFNGFKELPRDIKNLVNLRHLELKSLKGLTHMPHGLGQLTNLWTLSQFVLSASTNSRHSGEVGQLKELMPLNNLRGDLWITNLRHGKDAIVGNLKEKQYLQSLRLDWCSPNNNVEAMDSVGHEMTLEGLQPHPNLKELRLYNYGGVRLPSWLPSLKQLVVFALKGCMKCLSLPPLAQFPSLKSLTLHDMPALEYISNGFFSSSASLPSLVHLSLRKLPNLEGWWSDVTDGADDNCFGPFGTKTKPSMGANCTFLSFPCISSLHIEDCPKLRFLPFSPSIKRLTLENSIWKPFHQTMMGITTPQTQITTDRASGSTSYALIDSCFSHLISNLEHLCLCNIEDLHSLPIWLKYLSSLKSLRIRKCPKLKYLSPGTQHLVSLQYLYIEECKELDMSSADAIMWEAYKSLHSLQIYGLPQLKALPEGLQHVTTLQVLFIGGCNSLMAIPEAIRNLTSLTELVISECPNLTSLPEGIRSINTLQVLNIWNCPILSRRCQREKGEDWCKVAHIPNLQLEFVDDSQSFTLSGHKWKIFKSFRVPQLCNK